MRKKIELLAPAGDKNIFKAAVDAGADAIYCGIDLFNARMNASNLTMDELSECCAYAHERSAFVHLTLNTLVNDDEIDSAVDVAREAYNSGVDAILVQDTGLAYKIHEKYPSIPLHASTQMNVFDLDKLRSLKGRGFTRVVLPRELSMKEIISRTRAAGKAGIETEVFIHGAVCICTSGLCLFSSMNKSGTRSGNRGLCAQPCRQMYELANRAGTVTSGHLLSPKDRSALRYIGNLIDAGVSSVKIEGRMRDEDYVVSAVRAYRKAIDAYYEGTLTDELTAELEKELLVNFNRGGSFTSQTLPGEKDPDILSGEYVGKYGLRIGRITLRDCKEGTITIKPSGDAVCPSRGDYLSLRSKDGEIKSFPVGKITGYKGSFVVKGLHPSSIKDLPSDVNVYLMNHDFSIGPANKRKTHIDVSFDASDAGVIKGFARVTDGPFEDICCEDELSYTSEGRNFLSSQRIEEQLCKTGNTAFFVDNVYVSGCDNAYCSVKDINELRRGLLEMLSSEILSEASHIAVEQFSVDALHKNVIPEASGEIKTLVYFPSVSSLNDDLPDADIYAFSSYDYSNPDFRAKIDSAVTSANSEMLIVKPDFCHDEQASKFAFEDSVRFMPTAGSNIFNSGSLRRELDLRGEAFISYEVSRDDALEMLRRCESRGTVFVHCNGFIPWMQSDFCPVGRNRAGCCACKGKGTFILKQESGPDLKIITHPSDCSSVIMGPAKYIFDDAACEAIAKMGYNVIKCYTEV